ncbi:hypothetical protein [Azorhizobium doebereinerae]|uniref:hypothetical protein n=1 Tax=Azorhizobium doebereinerae TaxID=281091 RepID=UPI0003FB0AD2|nr:hypothetical protein [Azorhizobium doebereinerae]
MTGLKSLAGAGVVAAAMACGAPAFAQECLEQIVALQNRLPQPPLDAPVNAGPSARQTVGTQLDHQPTPGSVAAASGGQPQLSGAQAYLNKAENLQAAGDKAGCLQAVEEARKLLDRK